MWGAECCNCTHSMDENTEAHRLQIGPQVTQTVAEPDPHPGILAHTLYAKTLVPRPRPQGLPTNPRVGRHGEPTLPGTTGGLGVKRPVGAPRTRSAVQQGPSRSVRGPHTSAASADPEKRRVGENPDGRTHGHVGTLAGTGQQSRKQGAPSAGAGVRPAGSRGPGPPAWGKTLPVGSVPPGKRGFQAPASPRFRRESKLRTCWSFPGNRRSF